MQPFSSHCTDAATSENLTQRFSAADLPAAMDMISATKPSSPEHGDGLSFTSASTKASVSCLYLRGEARSWQGRGVRLSEAAGPRRRRGARDAESPRRRGRGDDAESPPICRRASSLPSAAREPVRLLVARHEEVVRQVGVAREVSREEPRGVGVHVVGLDHGLGA